MELNTVMTANPACCGRETSLQQVAKMMAENDCGMIPVVDQQGMPVGAITDRDIAVRAVAKGGDMDSCCAGDYMSSPVRTVSQDSTLADCCAAMESAQLRRMPVVDAQGRLVGVVAQADIALNSNPSTTAEVVQEISRPS
jgi:CBS domain-containing protein